MTTRARAWPAATDDTRGREPWNYHEYATAACHCGREIYSKHLAAETVWLHTDDDDNKCQRPTETETEDHYNCGWDCALQNHQGLAQEVDPLPPLFGDPGPDAGPDWMMTKYGQVPVLLLGDEDPTGGRLVDYRGPLQDWVETWDQHELDDIAEALMEGLAAETPVIFEDIGWTLVRYDLHDEHGPLVPEQGPKMKENEDDWR